ncbi:hypothetical protein [Polyangium sp. y55x31]|uniref:hypothetical protein n=1 Tax=Polyangium sp. y55x31 TaxID=3042688 RepID=UPI00248256D6|nr:hypothetical protein [Polyangium sp. y55x31]MDI1475905.1 hypothetical protein [Polyangium sp. y55x31]
MATLNGHRVNVPALQTSIGDVVGVHERHGRLHLVYVAKGRIPRVYLLDAGAELGILMGWAASRRGR